MSAGHQDGGIILLRISERSMTCRLESCEIFPMVVHVMDGGRSLFTTSSGTSLFAMGNNVSTPCVGFTG